MTTYRVIAEHSGGEWKAWFEDAPHLRVSTAWPRSSVDQLIAVFAERSIDRSTIDVDTSRVRDRRIEFLCRCRTGPEARTWLADS